MVPIIGEWDRFADKRDKILYFRKWGLISEKGIQLHPVMVRDGADGEPQVCEVVGHQGETWAVVELGDGFHAVYGEYLAEMQPDLFQKLPRGTMATDILQEYVIFDIETTGLSRQEDAIIEIAAIRYRYRKKVDEFYSLVNPGIEVPPNITELTGITTDDLIDAPSWGTVSADFSLWLGDTPVIGHNAVSFDMPFIVEQSIVPFPNMVFDTLPMARGAFPELPRHKLSYLKDVLKLGDNISHRAMADVETTFALLWACLTPKKYITYSYWAAIRNDQKPKKEPHAKRHAGSAREVQACTECVVKNSPLMGKVLVITGELSVSREKALTVAAQCGALVKDAVTRKTDFLILGKPDLSIVGLNGMSTKERRAREINEAGKGNISIISEEEYWKLVREAAHGTA